MLKKQKFITGILLILMLMQLSIPVHAITVDTSGQKTTVAATAAPAVSSTDTATQVPQTTASPGATPEPDIITYPPTVAPAYTD